MSISVDSLDARIKSGTLPSLLKAVVVVVDVAAVVVGKGCCRYRAITARNVILLWKIRRR